MKMSRSILMAIIIFALIFTTGAYMRINGNFGDGNGTSLTLTGDMASATATLTGDMSANDIVLTGDMGSLTTTITGNMQALSGTFTGTLSNVGIGTSTFGTNADGVLAFDADGVIPSTSPAGIVQIFAVDSSDGSTNATLAFRTEQAVESDAFTATHMLKIWVNGTEYWISLDTV